MNLAPLPHADCVSNGLFLLAALIRGKRLLKTDARKEDKEG